MPAAKVKEIEDATVANKQNVNMSSLSLRSALPRRPGYATMGRPIKLLANYFDILPKPDLQLFRYHIDVVPLPTPMRRRKRAFQLFLEKAPFLSGIYPAAATDYSSTMVTLKKLNLGPEGKTTHEVLYYEPEESGPKTEDPKKFTFQVTYTNALSVQELMDYLKDVNKTMELPEKASILQVLNIAMARKPNSSSDVASFATRNKFFPLGGEIGDLGGGLVALRGYYTSVRTATLRLLLNVNSITATFYKPGPLFNLMSAFRESLRGGPVEHRLGRFLKGVRVTVSHLKTENKQLRTKVIAGIEPHGHGANKVEFYWEEKKKKVTVQQYFKDHYRITLTKPAVPCINLGNAQHPIWTPPELCQVVAGQIANQKLTPDQTAEMILVACRRPRLNAEYVTTEGAQVVGVGEGIKDGPTLFGLSVPPKMIAVDGRILQPPTLEYAKKSQKPSFGSWNMSSLKFSAGVTMQNWTYFQIQWNGLDNLKGRMEPLVKEFSQVMTACGLTMDAAKPGIPPLNLNPHDTDRHDQLLSTYLQKIRNDRGQRKVLIILPSRDLELYARIKYWGDVVHGLHTVCSVATKLMKESGRTQYLANIGLKWNLKLGGINQTIQPKMLGILGTSKTMVVGIDVTHPSPGSREGAPSVAGVVASTNASFAQYPASVRVQESRKEMVTDLKEMIVERLELWRKKNMAQLPQNILVYRDGVSEGQYQTVLDQEGRAFDQAVAAVYGPKAIKPKISIVIVGKRHHTRFYPTDPNDMDTRTGNPCNGTVVDRGVTSEINWDFFLQAHTGLQGTARPAHYIVVRDDIRLGANGLEQLTHNLCYLYGRATKAVSICTPAYYADLVCERARCYLYDTFNSEAGSSAGASFNIATARWSKGVHEDLKDTMFYI